MNRFEDPVIEEIYWTRFAKEVPEHVALAAYRIVQPLVAACSLQDVAVLGQIYRWHNAPRRLGLQADGKWYVTFAWCVEIPGAFEIRIERR